MTPDRRAAVERAPDVWFGLAASGFVGLWLAPRDHVGGRRRRTRRSSNSGSICQPQNGQAGAQGHSPRPHSAASLSQARAAVNSPPGRMF